MNLLERTSVRYYILNTPAWFNLRVLPQKIKNKVIKIYNEYIQWLQQEPILDISANNEPPIIKIKNMLNYMNKDCDQLHFAEFYSFLKHENLVNVFKQTFPELLDLYYESKLHSTKN